MKLFNRTNEILAEAAEKASVAAAFARRRGLPGERLRDAWIQFLWHQFHDDLTGTSIPQAYQFSWNDEMASLNQFAGVLTHATSAVSDLLDTTGAGVPLVVYNPVSMDRTEAIEATVKLAPAATGRAGHRCRDRAGRARAGHRRADAAMRASRSSAPCRRSGTACSTSCAAAASAGPASLEGHRQRRSRTTASA